MSLKKIQADYVDLPTAAAEMGVPYIDVFNWTRSRWADLKAEYFFDKPLILRTEFERFKAEHPELIQKSEEPTP